MQMSTVTPLSISTALLVKKNYWHRAAAAPGPEVHRECPIWHNFHLCPSSQ